ncbi:hypothetical protein CTA1_8539 [Colletotrichum tanaceti]|uniref:Uncharacterized protein n=1 Tax=Colletotrichum tanaceti TaxID=1306861 RepID=A0A4V6DI10_9PEZI|nr:hypothetical protein CTA1_8539 [Colletotrichum tanaceti]
MDRMPQRTGIRDGTRYGTRVEKDARRDNGIAFSVAEPHHLGYETSEGPSGSWPLSRLLRG